MIFFLLFFNSIVNYDLSQLRTFSNSYEYTQSFARYVLISTPYSLIYHRVKSCVFFYLSLVEDKWLKINLSINVETSPFGWLSSFVLLRCLLYLFFYCISRYLRRVSFVTYQGHSPVWVFLTENVAEFQYLKGMYLTIIYRRIILI